MSSEKILERERSRVLAVTAATFAGVALLIAAITIGQGGTTGRSVAQILIDFPDNRDNLLLSAILQAVGIALLAAPLFYLFEAASARSDQMRHALIGITIAAPLFLAAAFILEWVAYDAAASSFADPNSGLGVPVGDYAEDLLQGEVAFDASQGLRFAGTLGLVVAVVYTALHAMRVGLLTRFWGSLGMALGVSILFLGLLGMLVFFVAIGALVAGVWPGGRPPAWAAGEAVPWPVPGEEPAAEPDDPDRPADPEQFSSAIEGSATEVAGDGDAEGPGGSGAPRKRKRRR